MIYLIQSDEGSHVIEQFTGKVIPIHDSMSVNCVEAVGGDTELAGGTTAGHNQVARERGAAEPGAAAGPLSWWAVLLSTILVAAILAGCAYRSPVNAP